MIDEQLKQRFGKTGSWLFEHASIKQWLDAKQSMILWYDALPGFGKTILASITAQKLRDDGKDVVTFFYTFTDGDLTKTITALQSLALQLLNYLGLFL
jgi:replication-associated recombination protein RarA